jgi:hypothetical protein
VLFLSAALNAVRKCDRVRRLFNFLVGWPCDGDILHDILSFDPLVFLAIQQRVFAMRYSDSTSTITNWEELDQQDIVDSSLATEIFEQHEYMSGENREKPRRQKLLDELVPEHIEGNRPSMSKLQLMFNKFLYRK